MNLTNEFNLPDIWVKALTYSDYNAGDVDASVTDLLKSPRQFWLKRRHGEEVEVDVSSLNWQLLGNAAHYIAEIALQGEDAKLEERMTVQLGNYSVSGKADAITKDSVDDFKITSVWKIVFGELDDWIQQLKCYRAMHYMLTGETLDNIRNHVLLRDWSAREAQREGAKSFDTTYPQAPVLTVDHKLDESPKETIEWMKDRIAYLMSFADTPDDELPDCNEKERWYRGGKYKVFVKGNKRAMTGGVKDDFREAKEVAVAEKERNPKRKYEVKHVPGTSNACNYCIGRHFCSQYKEMEELSEELVFEV